MRERFLSSYQSINQLRVRSLGSTPDNVVEETRLVVTKDWTAGTIQ